MWTGTSCFVLEVPLCNLLTSIFNFVPCDRIVQRAYYGHIESIQRRATKFILKSDDEYLVRLRKLHLLSLDLLRMLFSFLR